MDMTVTIDSRRLATPTEVAGIVAEQNGWTLTGVEGTLAGFSNPEKEMYGYEEYRVDLRTGCVQGRDDGGEWTNDGIADCPLRDEWDQIPWVEDSSGKILAVT